MISIKDALRVAENHFPNGPEELIRRLGIEVHYSPLSCDGWCLVTDRKAIIRINDSASETRQRFTLAHELSHILLGVPTLIGEEIFADWSGIKNEEKEVNKLASRLLLPESFILSEVDDLPIVAKTIKKLAKKAKVSEFVVALRLAAMADQLGILGASVIFFHDDQVKWQWSPSFTIREDLAISVLEECKICSPQAFRHHRAQHKDVIVASLVENSTQGTFIMFIQFLDEQDGLSMSRDEHVGEIANQLYSGDDEFRRRLEGCLGAFKPKAVGMTLDEAINRFNDLYMNRWPGERSRRLKSPIGQKYIKLRLSEWCHKK
jgi:Zn-dependent peptidase ImmA (M78 family)